MDRKELIKEKGNITSKEANILLVLTYNQSLLDITKDVHKHWNILSINKTFKEIFQNQLVTAFRQRKFEGTDQ